MAVRAPGSVRFEAHELELIQEAQIILITHWTHEEYLAQPAALVDAVWQIHNANRRIENRAQRSRKRR